MEQHIISDPNVNKELADIMHRTGYLFGSKHFFDFSNYLRDDFPNAYGYAEGIFPGNHFDYLK